MLSSIVVLYKRNQFICWPVYQQFLRYLASSLIQVINYCLRIMLTPAMLDVVVLTTRISTIDFFYSSCSLPLSSTHGRCRAGRRVRERRARNIHRIQSVVSYQRTSRGSDNLHKGPISNNLCVVTPVNINTHSSPNVTSTNPSLHTNLFVNPRSAFLNFAVFNSRSVRNKIESIIDDVVENDIGLCTLTET